MSIRGEVGRRWNEYQRGGGEEVEWVAERRWKGGGEKVEWEWGGGGMGWKRWNGVERRWNG